MLKVFRTLFGLFVFAGLVACGGNSGIGPASDASVESTPFALTKPTTAKGGGNGGETAFSCDADGVMVGYEGECPSVGVYEYTLWAGKHNDAGRVSIWADDVNIYVKYDTNETADLQEAHVYVWTDLAQIPSKRPAPGQAPYTAEQINADSYLFVIPASDFGAADPCGSTFYISTHAALIGEGGSTIGGDGDNGGETAYGGGPNSPTCFDGQKGAWWGYVNFTVECYYDVVGTAYEDSNNNGSFDAGEAVFAGISVSAGSETTTTATDGSYSFLLPAGESFTITSASPNGDYLANENAGGYSTGALSACLEDVDFGFVPLYDIGVDVNLSVDGDCSPDVVVSINGNEISPDGEGNYTLENQLPATEYVVVVTASSGEVSVSETQTIVSLNANKSLSFNLSFTCGGDDGDDDDFPLWNQDISHVILVFSLDSNPNGNTQDNDGYYTIKIDEYQDVDPDDLDGDIDAYLVALIADGLLSPTYDLLGASIKGGTQTTSFYSYGDYNTNGEASDLLPEGIGFSYTGGSDNESGQNSIDVNIVRAVLLQ